MDRFLKLALGFYVLATSLGLVLRASFLWPVPGLVFSHALHAHSHTLYFGWAGLALVTLAFRALGAEGRAVRAVLWSITCVAAATFVAFLHSGYGPPGIAVSATSVFAWGGAAGVWLWHARGKRGIDVSFLRAAFGYMGLALLGALARVVLLAAGVREPLWGALAVFSFLHNFAWFFVLAVMGLVVAEARRAGAAFDDASLRRMLRGMVALAWLTFPLGAPGGDAGALGVVARVATAGLLVPEVLWVVALWRAAATASASLRPGLEVLAGWFGVETVLETAGVLGLAGQAVALRHPAILFLHVLLVGCVTLGLALPLLGALGRPHGRGLALHTGGLLVMSLGLALLGAVGAGLPGVPAAALPSLARAGMVLAWLGGVPIVLAGVAWAWPRARVASLAAVERVGTPDGAR